MSVIPFIQGIKLGVCSICSFLCLLRIIPCNVTILSCIAFNYLIPVISGIVIGISSIRYANHCSVSSGSSVVVRYCIVNNSIVDISYCAVDNSIVIVNVCIVDNSIVVVNVCIISNNGIVIIVDSCIAIVVSIVSVNNGIIVVVVNLSICIVEYC